MATLLDLPAGLYRGRVSGSESGSCEARIEVQRVPGSCVAVDYEAVGIEGVQHEEHTIIAPATLVVAHSEATGVHIFSEVSPGVFESGPAGPYIQRLMLDSDGKVLTWAWHWAPGGEEPQEQSRAVVELVGG